MNQKGQAPILIVVAILVLLAIAAGAYYFGKSQTLKIQSPSPVVTSPIPQLIPSDETSNWKIYSDEEFKFQIKYPPNWYTEKQSSSIYISESPIPDIPLTHGLPSAFQMSVDSISSENFSPVWKVQESVITIDKVQGKKFVDLEPSPALEVLETRIILDNSPYRYTFVFQNKDNQGTHNPVFDQILSTFKFTNQNQTSETANWKTCRNILLEIEFKYPPNWYIDGCSGEVIVISSSAIAPAPIDGPRGDIDISSGRSSNVQTYDEAVQRGKDSIQPETLKTSSINISTKQGTQISGFLKPSPMGEGFYKDTLFPSKDVVLGISLINESQEKIYDQILSTFRFTN